MPILLAALFGLLSKNISPIVPKITVPVHIVIYGSTRVIPFCQKWHYLYWVFFCFVVESVIYLACIKICPRETDWEMPNAKVMDMTAWKTGKVWAAVGVAVIIVTYAVCSPLVLGA